MGKGRTYELDMVRDANDIADSDMVFCATLDYSGSASDSDADLVLGLYHGRDDYRLHLVELKKRSGEDGKRFPTHPMGGSTPTENGYDELTRLATTGPNHAKRWLALKPDHRELVVYDAEWLLWHVTEGREGRMEPYSTEPDTKVVEATSPRLTPGGNVSMTKPSLDSWPSSTAGMDDAEKLLRELDIPEHYIEN